MQHKKAIMEPTYFPEIHFVMQHFAHVSKSYLSFCYPGITNTTCINLSRGCHLGKGMFSIIGINKLPSITTVFPGRKIFYHQGV